MTIKSQNKQKEKQNMAELKSTSEEKIHFRLSPKTPGGNPANVETTNFEVVSGDATLEVDEDGLGATAISGSEGTSVIRVSADADLGEGVETISLDIDYVVTAPEANSLGFSADAPVLK